MYVRPKTIALCIFAAFLATTCGAARVAEGDVPRKYVRQSLHEFFKDPKKVESLTRGVVEMKRRSSADPNSAEFRTSWKYWTNMHGYVGEGERAGYKRDGVRTLKEVQQSRAQLVPDVAPLLDVFYTLNNEIRDEKPLDALANETWGMCPHASDFFLPWHRMYLYFFERTLRKASGDPDFALPYWDYTNTAIVDAGVDATPTQPLRPAWSLPRAYYRLPLETQPKPLFEPRRTVGFGTVVQVNTETTDIDSVLRNEKFFDKFVDDQGRPQDRGFQRTLETGLHGYIHCLVGNGCLAPYIGLVPLAANDPVFWHHHANLDRLWSCWTQAWGENANPINNEAWMSQTYVFPDENGERKNMAVSELFDPKGRIDFNYDKETGCLRDTTRVVAVAPDAAAAAASVQTEAGAASEVRVSMVDQRVRLALPSATAVIARDRLRTASEPGGPRWRRALLSISGVISNGAPGASVAVYLDNTTTGRRAFVGVMSFFHDGGHEHDGAIAGNSYGFEVSSQLRRLLDGGEDSLSVALVASGGVVGAAELSNKVYTAAGLRIGEIRLLLE